MCEGVAELGEIEMGCKFGWKGQNGQVHNLVEQTRTGPFPTAGNDSMVWVVTQADLQRAVADSHGEFVPASHRAYVFELTLVRADKVVELPLRRAAWMSEGTVRAAEAVKDLPTSQLPHDVRFVFPKSGRELWSNQALLARASPYFETLFSSDFGVSAVLTRAGGHSNNSSDVQQALTEDADDGADSDDETDEVLTFEPFFTPHGTDVPFRQISISDAAYSTYYALLVYLQTDFIHFAPLSSSSAPLDPTASLTRKEKILQVHAKQPSLPVPVSPKSTYRLARLLSLPDLQARSLAALSSEMSFEGASFELFSDAASCYDDVRGTVLNFVVQNWKEVSATANWKAAMARVKAGEVPNAGAVMVELVPALAGTAF
ncbi:hypothetical protein JCM10213_000787 [Rhodosporidiobolus nylandii]